MMHRILATSAAALALALGACNQDTATKANADGNSAMTADAEGDAAAVKTVEDGIQAAFTAKDAAKLSSYYASDAVLAVPERTVKGAEAIAKANDEDMKDPAFKLDFTNEKTDASGDLAYTSGSFKVTYTDAKTKQPVDGAGTYVTVFKKQADGTWKVVADIATPTGG